MANDIAIKGLGRIQVGKKVYAGTVNTANGKIVYFHKGGFDGLFAEKIRLLLTAKSTDIVGEARNLVVNHILEEGS